MLCPYCNKENPDDSIFCGYCGHKQTPQQEWVSVEYDSLHGTPVQPKKEVLPQLQLNEPEIPDSTLGNIEAAISWLEVVTDQIEPQMNESVNSTPVEVVQEEEEQAAVLTSVKPTKQLIILQDPQQPQTVQLPKIGQVEIVIEKWKQQLLDIGKRNRLLNYKETRRSNIIIIKPDVEEIYESLVQNEKTLEFATIDRNVNLYNYDTKNDDGAKILNNENMLLERGQILTNRTDSEMLKTISSLRAKAKTAIEEQGVNVLYLTFGFLEWKEVDISNVTIKSPLVLVPVELTIESMVKPYKLTMLDDDIVVNPTLLFKLKRDFNIELPALEDEDAKISDYLNIVEQMVAVNGWRVVHDVHLSLFSFLKLNMYEDLDKYGDKASEHPIVRALAGDKSMLLPIPDELKGVYSHDDHNKPVDTFQIVDADSYQQDAIIAGKKGVSFVLQGPPGTGKSQTITNIIAECLADGKKVLFVSEKMAALEVVSKRLTETKLIDFCLQLHSHKAKKTEVLGELGRTLNLGRIQTHDEILADLDQLLEERNKLNAYGKELHTPCQPLNKTIYEIHGRLLRYQHAPDITFDFSGVDKYTENDVNHFDRLLKDFSRTVDKMGEDYASNPWYGCNQNFSYEFQQDVIAQFKTLADMLVILADISKQITTRLQLPKHQSVEEINLLLGILAHAENSTKPPLAWITDHDIGSLIARAAKNQTNVHLYEKLKQNLLSRYQETVLNLPATFLKKQIEKGCKQLCLDIKLDEGTTPDLVLEKRNQVRMGLEDVSSTLAGITGICDQLSGEFGIITPGTFNEAKMLLHLAKNLITDPKPMPKWFDTRQFNAINQRFSNAYALQARKTEIDLLLINKFDDNILEIDFNNMLISFRKNSVSLMKIFYRTYHNVKKEFKSRLINPKEKLTDAIILDYLQQLKVRGEISKWFADNQVMLLEQLGDWYNREYTDWDALYKAMSAFSEVIRFFRDEQVTLQIKTLLTLSGSPLRQIAEKAEHLDGLLKKLENHETMRQIVALADGITDSPFIYLREKIESILHVVVDTTNSYEKVVSCITAESPVYTILQNDLTDVNHLQAMIQELVEQEAELNDSYFLYYKGLETDWQTVLLSLNWASSLKEMVQIHALPINFIKLICNDDNAIRVSGQFKKELESILDNMKPSLTYIETLFDEGTHPIRQMGVKSFAQWLNTCIDNFSALQEWVDFKNQKQKCKDAGLGDFIQKVIESKLPKNNITNAFFKRFYRLWLDTMYPRFPAVNIFRSRNHETILDDFRTLDKKQLVITRTRIREILSSHLPSQTSLNSGFGEMGILRHELGKRRKIMPLRKLFRKIPNLLMAIKPCLLMSPLSVSLFLNPESYQFDVIIFDEASQIRPEDAIGAIVRGKQVIIAGDSEQLPPTNFFRTGLDDSDLEDEEEDDETSGFESILDKARTVLHEMSLRWHYRSKHEHLIAFSNAKIYSKLHNGLITFPSNVDRFPDHGVEYIYVPNGVYQRSTTRSNKIEAERVAQLVFEHFRKYPMRSLGVVTFSEAQQDEIEAAVRRLRQNSLEFEQFFDEYKFEAFFIKNLENVQGDERDTIIFSIGYARDHNRVMYMNFGPLSRDGGYRRLNVAITRAKYNVKLVGSIRSTDIDLDRTNSKGVQMLRSYIDFAQNGLDAIRNELIIPESIYFDSPFEEEVYKMLRAKGYNMDTQIGCSGYRIDMAVRHYTISGLYVLGIECDGATYHSARTARERDRLREDVLQGCGWKLYRIWSTDWIKDQHTESERLITAIDDALNNTDQDGKWQNVTPMVTIDQKPITAEQPIEIIETITDQQSEGMYGLIKYEIFDLNRLQRQPRENERNYVCRSIREVLTVESPIHFDLLCQRLATLFGREKATSVVKENIEYTVKTYMVNDVNIKDGFYWDSRNPKVQTRVPSGELTKRKIEHICKEELAEGMLLIVGCSYGISPGNLIVETTKSFGFNRTGENIRNAMIIALDYLVTEGRVQIVDEKVLCFIL